MRGWILSTLGVLFAFFVQVSLGRRIAIAGVVPELVLVAVVLSGLSRGAAVGAVLGFLGGFYEDLYLPSFLGLNSLAKTLVGFLAGEAGERLRREQPATQAAIFVTLAAIHEAVRNLLSLGLGVFDLFGRLLLHDLLAVVYTTIVGVGIAAVGRNVLFGGRRFVESVTSRRRVR